tara:strand:+ start:154 stop:420 length:267 start_codon:yes stop_codon:yes gene_type:complete
MAHKIVIEKGVPLPERITSKEPLGHLPLLDMEVGDSFKIKVSTKEEMAKKVKTLRTRVYRINKKNPDYKFSVVRMLDHIRIYRIETKR